jgi:WD40 repeat protein
MSTSEPTPALSASVAERPTIPPEPPPDATQRPSVPGYEILGELGRGGMGVVYRARQIALNRLVALKMILAGGHAGETELARFRTEAEAIARLRHPNIVQIYEVGQADSYPFFSLEFVDGGSLAAQLDGTPQPPEAAARLVETLARGIHTAHQQGIIHRDLKPANILLSFSREPPASADAALAGGSRLNEAVPKITDFGLAKKLDEAAGPTVSGAIMGTPSYMAPEQAGGESKTIGAAADIYALGAILYELLTGRPPFKAATPMDTVFQVLSEEPVPVRQLQPKVPVDLETIALKCLEKESGKRYSSAQALADDLGRFLSGEPIVARPVGWLERLSKWAKRRPAVAGLVAVSVMAVLALGGFAAYFTVTLAERNRRLGEEVVRAEAAEQAAGQRATEANAARHDAEWQRSHAEEEKSKAEAQRDRAERLVYAGQLSLAQREWQDNHAAVAKGLLDASQNNLRGWEHRYLNTLFNHLGQRTFLGHIGPVTGVCFSPDGTRLASASWDQTVKVWDAAKGQELLTLKGHTNQVSCVCFSPNGQRLASASFDQTVKTWDAVKGQELLTLKGHLGLVYSVCFSPDGQRLASASFDQTVKIWDAVKGQEILTLKGHTLGVLGLCFSPDGRRLASASFDQTVKIWDTSKGQELLSLQGHTGWVYSVCFSPDGQRLASASADQTVKVWDTSKGQELLTLKGHTNAVLSVCFSPDSKRLASASADQTLKVWDAAKGHEVLGLKGHTNAVSGVCFSPDQKRLASAGWDQTVKVWDAVKGQEVLLLKGHTNAVSSVCFSPDSQRLASASWDQTVRLWDMAKGQEVLTLKGHTGWVYSVTFSPDGQRLASASADQTVKVWDAAKGQEVRTLQGHTGEATSVCFSPDGTRLASASADRTVKVWDAAKGRELLTLKGHTGMVSSVCFSPDGQRLASASGDRTVRIWDAATGQEVFTLQGHTGWVRNVCFSPDSQRLASASYDGTVKIWDAATGQEVRTLKGRTGYVTGVCFSPDGQRLASASYDGTVKIWDTATGQEVLTLKAHTLAVLGLCFSPDGQRLASASGGWDQLGQPLPGELKVWDGTSGQLFRAVAGKGTGSWGLLERHAAQPLSQHVAEQRPLPLGVVQGHVRVGQVVEPPRRHVALDRRPVVDAEQGHGIALDVQGRVGERALAGEADQVPVDEQEVVGRRVRHEHRGAGERFQPRDVLRHDGGRLAGIRPAGRPGLGPAAPPRHRPGMPRGPRQQGQVGLESREQRFVGSVGGGGETEHRMRTRDRAVRFHVRADIDLGHRSPSVRSILTD